MTIVSACDLRPVFGTARNQGSRPTCVAFAVSDAHAAARGPFEFLSVEYLYYHSIRRTPGGHPDDGVTLSIALDALGGDGQCIETGWPYIESLPADLSTWKPPATADPVLMRDSEQIDASVGAILNSLDIGVPAVFTLLISECFFDPIDGVVGPSPGDIDVDYHAVLAVGHGRDGLGRYVLIRNSWGEDWGFAGHAWINTDYLEPRLYRVAVISTEEIN